MRIAVLEDDKWEREQMQQALQDWDASRKAEFFSDGTSLLEAAEMSPPFSIAFLDIYLPGENGMEIAERLQARSPETGIVFVTTSADHAVEAFSLHALHYLVKPVTVAGITEAFRRLTALQADRRETVSFTVGRDSYTVYQDEICCMESFNHTLEISLADGRILRVRMPLTEIEQRMSKNFLKINRGTLVNMEQIEQMCGDICILHNGIRLPIAVRKRAEVLKVYSNFLFSRLSAGVGPETEVER